MRLDEIEWEYQGDSVRVGMTWHGQGASVLMLPALSSISNSKRDVAAAAAPRIVVHNVGHRLGGIW